MRQSANPEWPYRWDLLARYRLIEIVAQWEGRLTTNHLTNSFGIGRQQASKDINAYCSEVAPGNLVYDKHLKGYKPTEAFKPRVTSGLADEYLHVMSRSKDMAHTFEALNLGFAQSHILETPARVVEPRVLRPIIQAVREKKRVEVEYVSLQNPVPEPRVIAPHALVCTPLRWHVRAYCEKNRGFRDFVLSRFRATPELLGSALSDVGKDEPWNTRLTLQFVPDPRLSTEQKSIIESDYGMKDGVLAFATRAALVDYTMQAFNLDPTKLDPKPEAQQLVVANYDEVKKFMYSE